MISLTQIDAPVFEDAPTVAAMPAAVSPLQPNFNTQAAPAWYLTPVAVIPLAGVAFIVGNVLMMIPWSTL